MANANETASVNKIINKMTSASETVMVNANASEIIHPRRLVMVQSEDNCMFCPHPKGESISTYVDVMNKLGYISCLPCRDNMEEAVKAFDKRVSMERVAHLRNKEFCIRRSSGEVEGGWSLMFQPITFDAFTQTEIILCSRCHPSQAGKDIVKWCIVEDIVRLNPC
jgi:hypothetical protein